MKKLLHKKFLLLLLLLPCGLIAQDISGIWKGQIYVDSTKMYLPYEISISNVKGKLIGYSHITFEQNGRQETGLRDIDIERKENIIIIEDISFIANSFNFVPPKNVKKTMTVTLSETDTSLVLKGSWSTNKTRHYLSATGTVLLTRINNYSTTVLYKRLIDLNLVNNLVFIAPVKNTIAVTSKPIEKIVIEKTTLTLAHQKNDNKIIAPKIDTSQKLFASVRPVALKIPSIISSTTTNSPINTQVPTKLVNNKLNTAVIIKDKITSEPNKNIALVKAQNATAKPFKAKAVEALPTFTPSAKVVLAQRVSIAPVVIENPKANAVIDVQDIKLQRKLPSVEQGAADINKRNIATIQSVFFKSDSLVLTLYDNGYVDGDTVSVVMNGEVIFSKQGLSTQPVTKTIYITKI